MELPPVGMAIDDVRTFVRDAGARDVAWREGRSWSLVYDSPGWHSALVAEAAAAYAAENALSHTAFPSASFFESQVLAMVSSVVSAERPAYGVFTSGGTESALLAMRAYRQAATEGRDEIVLPITAHPSFWKAADYLGLRLTLVPVGASGVVDPSAIAAAITPRSLVVVVSAPCFPFGTVDPIAAIAEAATNAGVAVHVDAALGGLFLPFLPDPPAFGFGVPGVASLSVDLHKYGYGPKGGSALLFATPELRQACYFVATGWPGGAYASPGALGTRPVGPAAGAFAAMVALGRSGYADLAARVMRSAQRLQEGLFASGFRLIGRPPMGVFAVTSDAAPPVRSVARSLEEHGWRIDAQPDPEAMHFIVFPRHEGVVDAFLEDVRAAVAQSRSTPTDGEQLSSYGVMVRGAARRGDLLGHLDDRFDGTDVKDLVDGIASARDAASPEER